MTAMTSISDHTDRNGLARAAGQLPGLNQAGPALPDDAVRRTRGPASATRYDQFRTIDAQAARQFFAGAYQPGWRVTGLASRSAVSHRRCEAGALTVDDVTIQGRVALEIPASDTVVVIQPRAGSMSVAGGPAATLEFPILVAHDLACVL